MNQAPEISVVVPSHDRPLRLRWLLNGLAEQTLERDRFEVVVCHDSAGPETSELLRTHPLARAGALLQIEASPSGAAHKRNRAWRAAGASTIVFTDDDCRPSADWLERALAAARANPGAILQGTTLPDPEEHVISRYAPWTATQHIRPPVPQAQTCNVVYPREVLERLGGFDETMLTAEDTELAERARVAGVRYDGAPDVLTWHAVDELGTLEMLRWVWRWKHVPQLFKRHPRLRREFPLYAFYSRAHFWLLVAVAGWLLGRRRPALTALALPYLVHRAPRYGSQPRARYRSLLELPALFAADASEIVALAWGSVKHRSLFL